jgi:hypothetical protein
MLYRKGAKPPWHYEEGFGELRSLVRTFPLPGLKGRHVPYLFVII